jgi:hypothetical protein
MMAHAQTREAGKNGPGRRRKITKEMKWMAQAVALDRQHQEGNRFKDAAEGAALHWADLPAAELTSTDTVKKAFSLLEACQDGMKRGILAEAFREAADVAQENRAKSMRALADKISSSLKITVDDFTKGF